MSHAGSPLCAHGSLANGRAMNGNNTPPAAVRMAAQSTRSSGRAKSRT